MAVELVELGLASPTASRSLTLREVNQVPNVETIGRLQTVVLWPFVKRDEYGEVVVGPPRGIKVRFQLVSKQAIDPLGRIIAIDAEMVVNEDISIDSLVFLGPMELATAGSQKMAVKTKTMTPDIHNVHIRRTVGLMRHNSAVVPLGS